MAQFTGMILTKKGRDLQAKAEAGAVLNFTKAKIGDGQLPAGQTLENLNDLVSPKKILTINSILPESGGLTRISTNITNAGITQGFYVREVGIFAQDPDVGEILYGITTSTSPDYLPPEGGATAVNNQFEIIIVVGNAASVSATIAPSMNAVNVGVTDTGGYYSGTNAETVLQEAGSRIASLEAQTLNSPKQQVTLKRGLQTITTDGNTPFNVLNLKGLTLVNLFGNDGNCEDISKWTAYQSTIAMDATNKVYGNNSIKFTASTNGVSRVQKSVSLDATKYFLFIIDAKNGNYSSGIQALFTSGTVTKLGSAVTDTTIFKPSYVKIAPADFNNPADVKVYAYSSAATTGQFGYFDGARLIEIDQATYNKIDVDPEYTGDKLSQKFPYVDNVKHLKNPVIRKYGKNLLPPFTEWTLHANAKVVEPYKLQLDATAAGQPSNIDIPVIGGQAYTARTGAGSNDTIVYEYKNGVYNGVGQGVISSTPATLTTKADTTHLRFELTSNAAGTLVLTNPQLELGSVATPFEPRNDEYLYLQTVLASSVGGTVYDSIFERDGQLFQLNRFKKDMVLDGSLPWAYDTDYAGFKRVYFPLVGAKNPQKVTGVKYDGKILESNDLTDNTTARNDVIHLTASNNIAISIADIESGFGEAYTPSAAEIQAYFYGYKMNNGAFGTPYNGTGTKTWTKITATDNIGSITVVPTTQASGVDNYKLTYQLANAVEEPITAEGSLMLHEGQNQLEVGEGIIVRERMNPALDSGSGRYVANRTDFASTLFSKRVEKILSVYKNEEEDEKWLLTNTYLPYGNYYPDIAQADYDPAAVYEVTYLTLDDYLFTSNIREVTGQYSTNDKTVLNEVVQQQSDLKTRVSVVENTHAKKAQGQWIAPVLQNGWVNFGGLDATAAYMKDEFGFVHIKGLVKGGVADAPIFRLPVGYRPSEVESRVQVANNGAGLVLSRIYISADGTVNAATTGSSYLTISAVFRVV